MICENCGAEIKNRESYCPNCGMELINPHTKSIKAKYMAGEYTENQNTYVPKNKTKLPKEKQEYIEEKDDPEVQQYAEADMEEYEESGVSILTVIILFLIVALLIGFVIGILIFSGFLQSLPGFSNL